MSLYGMMRTGVSGMAAQANRLGTVADNIANSNTTGYKRAYTEFSSLVLPQTGGASYNSGGVKTTIRNAISQEGVLQYTNSSTDLAISGEGFFVVQDASGTPFLARAGSFVADGQGRLVNSSGYLLTGYAFGPNGEEPATVANGFAGLQVISTANSDISAKASSEGILAANLPADPTSTQPTQTSLVLYNALGTQMIEEIEFTRTGNPNEWEVTAPNATGPVTLTFDPTTGKLAGPATLTLNFPNAQTVDIDLSAMTQLDSPFNIRTAQVDGEAPSAIDEVRVSADGIVSAVYKNGDQKNLYRIALATVQSPDQLTVLPGNVFSRSRDSGDLKIGFPEAGSFGTVISNALEGSNVDIASELTNMIESQRNYTANSKIFQTGSDLLEILVNLKR
jgi:flagellar hook protein FlgE